LVYIPIREAVDRLLDFNQCAHNNPIPAPLETLIQNMSMRGNLFLKQDAQITLDAEAKEILRMWA
jgi:hypothetical protein